MAVKEVVEKEVKRLKHKKQNQDSKGFTSQHHMAAEATVRKFRQFLRIKRRQRGIIAGDISDSFMDDRSRGSYWPGFEIDQDASAVEGLGTGNITELRETTHLNRGQ